MVSRFTSPKINKRKQSKKEAVKKLEKYVNLDEFGHKAKNRRSRRIQANKYNKLNVRREWDSNPRDPKRAHWFSRPAPSSARPSLLYFTKLPNP